jgi:hypothetical protein
MLSERQLLERIAWQILGKSDGLMKPLSEALQVLILAPYIEWFSSCFWYQGVIAIRLPSKDPFVVRKAANNNLHEFGQTPDCVSGFNPVRVRLSV